MKWSEEVFSKTWWNLFRLCHASQTGQNNLSSEVVLQAEAKRIESIKPVQAWKEIFDLQNSNRKRSIK